MVERGSWGYMWGRERGSGGVACSINVGGRGLSVGGMGHQKQLSKVGEVYLAKLGHTPDGVCTQLACTVLHTSL